MLKQTPFNNSEQAHKHTHTHAPDLKSEAKYAQRAATMHECTLHSPPSNSTTVSGSSRASPERNTWM